MTQYRKILLIADATMQRSAAFDEASWLAQATGATLHIALFDYNELIASVDAIDAQAMLLARDAYLQQHKTWLEQEASALRSRGLTVTTEVQWLRHPRDEILTHVREMGADIVVKGVHLEPLLQRFLYAPLDWQLLRLCPVPLLLVNGSVHSAPKRIIAAVDPVADDAQSQAMSDKIIRTALALALQCDAEVHLVYAYGALSDVALMTSSTLPLVNGGIYQQLHDSRLAAFAALADAHGVPAERRHFLPGVPALAIAEFAMKDKDDIIVLGTTQRTRLDRFVMGSTAERVLSYAPCNVLAVKPDAVAAASGDVG